MGLCASGKEAKSEDPIRILCLGIGGCGKTTFVRHMKILHGIPWDFAETERFVVLIRRNYLLVMGELLNVASKLKLNISEENQKYAANVRELLKERDVSIKENLPILKALWEDPAIQDIVNNHKEQSNSPLIGYFWDNVDRVMADDYKPSEDDILRVRVRTAGAYSTVIYVKPEYFEFFDVGGQKPERSKWEKVLQSHKFSCILYFVACDEWDVPDEEREFECSKLEMSKIIFNEVTDDQTIDKSVPIILFLNRSDLFESRLKTESGFASFKNTFADYKGGQNSEDAMEYIRNKFMSGVKRDSMKHHITNALDKKSMTPVFNAVKEYIFSSSFDTTGVEYDSVLEK